MRFAASERGAARTLKLVGGRGATGLERDDERSAGLAADEGGHRLWSLAPGENETNGAATWSPARVGRRAGQRLFDAADDDGRIYLVEHGCVGLFKALPGRRSICVGLLGPGDLVTQEATTDGLAPSGVAADALSDSTLAVYTADELAAGIAGSPAFAAEVVSALGRRLTGAQTLVEQILGRDISLRLATLLLHLAERFGRAEGEADGFVVIGVPMPHKLMARLIGANRVTITRVVGEFRDQGLAEGRGRNRIAVHPERLRAHLRRGSG